MPPRVSPNTLSPLTAILKENYFPGMFTVCPIISLHTTLKTTPQLQLNTLYCSYLIMYLLHTVLPKFRKWQYFLILEIPSTMPCSFHILGKCLQADYSFLIQYHYLATNLEECKHLSRWIHSAITPKRLVPPYNVIKDKLNSDDHQIYYCGQESLRRNRIALTVNKSPKCSTCVRSQKQQNDLDSFPRQTIQHHSNPSLCLNHLCQRIWSWKILWRPTRHSTTNTKKKLFFSSHWSAKVGSQETPGVTGKFGLGVQSEAGQRITELCQENTWVTANTLFQQHKRKLDTCTSPDGQYRNQTDYILFSQRWRSSTQ